MVRLRRVKVKGDEAFYHIISRTVQQQFLLGDVEKEKLVEIVKHFSSLYFVKVVGFCIMSNHFHLLIKSEPEHLFSDDEIAHRVSIATGKPKNVVRQYIPGYRTKLEDISEYMRQIKQSFSRWHNRVNNKSGTFWSDRFKSVLVEKGNAMDTVLAYIELNPIRAKIVEKPESYRFSSFGYRVGNKDNDIFLSYSGLSYEHEKNPFQVYRYLVYNYGGISKYNKGSIKESDIFKESKNNFNIKTYELLTYRIRYLTDGLIIGSKSFLKEAYLTFGGSVILKKNRHVYKTGFGDNVLSVRKLIG